MRRLMTLFVGAAVLVGGLQAQRAVSPGDWRHYAGTGGSTKYSALDQIHKGNVSGLRQVWRWSSPDGPIAAANPGAQPGAYQDTPLAVGGVLYTVTGLGIFAAIDAATGKTVWQYDPETWKAGRPNNVGFVHRGLAYWTDGKVERILAGTHDAYLLAIDAKTGKPDPTFGTNGRVDLVERLAFAERVRNYAVTSAPSIVRNVVMVGASIADNPSNKEAVRGDITGFDVRTGKRLWTFRSIPQPGEVGNNTWENGSAEFTGGTNVWTLTSVDEELGYVYLPFGTPTNDYYGGHRPGNNLFAESIVCLDATTGKRVWHFQGVHHGIWDYDFPAAPTLVDLTVDGKRIQALAQVSKQGFVYVLDRRTGTPVWPIEERPVPASTVPGEKASPTQPFPTKPPPFERQGLTDDNILDFTPELRKRALEIANRYDRGPLFTPPSEKGTIQLPGNAGGANWMGASFDPESGRLYVPSISSPYLVQIVKQDASKTNFTYRQGPATLPTIEGIPIVKPPYSRLTAYDLNQGTLLWHVPMGDGPRNHPLLAALKLGPLGGGRPFILGTRTLLFASTRGLFMPGNPSPEQPALVALDKASGETIWKTTLSAPASAPMTYSYGGKQYVAMAIGGGREAEIVAYALP